MLSSELKRLESCTPLATFRLPAGATMSDVRAAFLAAAKRFHPNRFARHDPEIRALATEVFIRIKDAYAAAQRLARPDSQAQKAKLQDRPVARRRRLATAPSIDTRSVLDAALAARVAERRRLAHGTPHHGTSVSERVEPGANPQFVQAKLLCKQSRFVEAVEILRRLVAILPGERLYQVHLHYALGREHATAQRLDEARAELGRAIELDPTFAPAREAIEGLGATKKRGLFARVFKR